MMKNKNDRGGAICGGVISESKMYRDMKKNIWANMMSYVMPDQQFKEYKLLKEAGEGKKANKLFDKYARSMI